MIVSWKQVIVQSQSSLLETKHQEHMGRSIAGEESVGIIPQCIVSLVAYPALLLHNVHLNSPHTAETIHTPQICWSKY